jgi:hypothetical protein
MPFKIIGNNGGKRPYGEVDKLVKTYNNNGFKGVTLRKLKEGLCDDSTSAKLTGKTIVTTETAV